MKLTPEEEKVFDERYQVLVDSYGIAADFLRDHKQEVKELVETVKDHLAGMEPIHLAPPLRPKIKSAVKLGKYCHAEGSDRHSCPREQKLQYRCNTCHVSSLKWWENTSVKP
jgi:hypothetical protein